MKIVFLDAKTIGDDMDQLPIIWRSPTGKTGT